MEQERREERRGEGERLHREALNANASRRMPEGIVQLMLANPSAFLPEGFQWSEYIAVEKIAVGDQTQLEENVQRTSPCCNAEIGGVMTDTSVIGLCRGCGHVVGVFDVVQKAVRVAEKVL